MIKDKQGKDYTIRQFFAKWKSGMQGITPLQMQQSQRWGYLITIAGIIYGIVYSALTKSWWLSIILIGSLIVIATQLIGCWQQIKVLKDQERIIKDIQNSMEKEVTENGNNNC